MTDKRPFPLHTGVAEVVAVAPVTPSMRRITLRHDAFGDGFGIEQPGEVLTLGWPPVGDRAPQLPDGGWGKAKWILRSTLGTEHWRNFTVRGHRPAERAIDVDFFVHGDIGRFSAWAGAAAPGERLAFLGPRIDWAPDPAAAWTLLVADETGLPALQAALERLPDGHPVTAVCVVAGPQEEHAAVTNADVRYVWLHRAGAPGTTTQLQDAVAALELPAGPGQAWGGAESGALREVRRLLAARDPAPALHMRGYWKRKG